MDSLQVTEDASAAVAKAPRISKEFIEHQITNIGYVTGDKFMAAAADRPVQNFDKDKAHLTICLMRVNNGFMVVGESAPMSPANFNQELGQQLAYEDAFRKLWPLYAFASLEDEWLYEQEAAAELRKNASNNDGETAAPAPSSPPANSPEGSV